MNKNGIIKDVFLNLFATFIPIMTLQFFILPIVARNVSPSEYGLIITLTTWINFSALSFGNILNNSRLIMTNENENNNLKGDYLKILKKWSFFNLIILSSVFIFFNKNLSYIDSILLLFTSSLILIKSYSVVEFRLKLNYLNILLESIFLSVGYLIGLVLFFKTDNWILIYFLGSFFSAAFVVLKSKVYSNYPITINFSDVKKESNSLLISGFLNASSIYLDKILVFSIFGGKAATIYYISTLFGKTFSMVLSPINNVFLSYIVKVKKFSKKIFNKVLLFTFFIGFISYPIVVLASIFSIKFLYPNFNEESYIYIYLNTLTIILITSSNIINTILLKIKKGSVQLLLNTVYLINFFIFSLTLSLFMGLLGFCLGIFIASSVKFVYTTYLVYKE